MANDIKRFTPFSDISSFEPFRGFDQLFRDFRLSPVFNEAAAEQLIRMDVTESDSSYCVKAEIPGARKEDISVDIDKNHITIKAETRKESEQKEGETVVRSERYFGQQYRSFTLARDVDEDKASARFENGILQLDLPKKSGPTSKKLPVH